MFSLNIVKYLRTVFLQNSSDGCYSTYKFMLVIFCQITHFKPSYFDFGKKEELNHRSFLENFPIFFRSTVSEYTFEQLLEAATRSIL